MRTKKKEEKHGEDLKSRCVVQPEAWRSVAGGVTEIIMGNYILRYRYMSHTGRCGQI